nr:MAG TPA: hypothetical protein [Siphoviridae sp. ctvS314]
MNNYTERRDRGPDHLDRKPHRNNHFDLASHPPARQRPPPQG